MTNEARDDVSTDEAARVSEGLLRSDARSSSGHADGRRGHIGGEKGLLKREKRRERSSLDPLTRVRRGS